MKIVADARCTIYVDGENKGIAEPSIPKKITLSQGEYMIKALSTERSAASTEWLQRVEKEELSSEKIKNVYLAVEVSGIKQSEEYERPAKATGILLNATESATVSINFKDVGIVKEGYPTFYQSDKSSVWLKVISQKSGEQYQGTIYLTLGEKTEVSLDFNKIKIERIEKERADSIAAVQARLDAEREAAERAEREAAWMAERSPQESIAFMNECATKFKPKATSTDYWFSRCDIKYELKSSLLIVTYTHQRTEQSDLYKRNSTTYYVALRITIDLTKSWMEEQTYGVYTTAAIVDNLRYTYANNLRTAHQSDFECLECMVLVGKTNNGIYENMKVEHITYNSDDKIAAREWKTLPAILPYFPIVSTDVTNSEFVSGDYQRRICESLIYLVKYHGGGNNSSK